MMRAARIENGLVADLWEVPTLTCFEGITLIEADPDVSMGATYDGANFTNPPVEMAALSPVEQIRAIERDPAISDAMQGASRLVALSYAIDDLIRIAESKGQVVTRTQAHNWAMVNDGNYRTLYEAEQAIKPLRVLV